MCVNVQIKWNKTNIYIFLNCKIFFWAIYFRKLSCFDFKNENKILEVIYNLRKSFYHSKQEKKMLKSWWKGKFHFFCLSAEFFSFFRSFNGSKKMKNVVNSKVPKSKFCYPNHGFKVYRKVVICVWKFIYVDQDSVSKFVPRNIINVFEILKFCLT